MSFLFPNVSSAGHPEHQPRDKGPQGRPTLQQTGQISSGLLLCTTSKIYRRWSVYLASLLISSNVFLHPSQQGEVRGNNYSLSLRRKLFQKGHVSTSASKILEPRRHAFLAIILVYFPIHNKALLFRNFRSGLSTPLASQTERHCIFVSRTIRQRLKYASFLQKSFCYGKSGALKRLELV